MASSLNARLLNKLLLKRIVILQKWMNGACCGLISSVLQKAVYVFSNISEILLLLPQECSSKACVYHKLKPGNET